MIFNRVQINRKPINRVSMTSSVYCEILGPNSYAECVHIYNDLSRRDLFRISMMKMRDRNGRRERVREEWEERGLGGGKGAWGERSGGRGGEDRYTGGEKWEERGERCESRRERSGRREERGRNGREFRAQRYTSSILIMAAPSKVPL